MPQLARYAAAAQGGQGTQAQPEQHTQCVPVCEELKDFEILDATPTPTSHVAEGIFEVAPILVEANVSALESQDGISLDKSIDNQVEEPLVQEIPISTYECELDEYGYFLGTFPAPKPIVCSLQLKLAADEEYERKVSSRNRLRIGFRGKSMSAILDTGSDVSTVSWPSCNDLDT